MQQFIDKIWCLWDNFVLVDVGDGDVVDAKYSSMDCFKLIINLYFAPCTFDNALVVCLLWKLFHLVLSTCSRYASLCQLMSER